MPQFTRHPLYATLQARAAVQRLNALAGQFEKDPNRFASLSLRVGELFADYSRHLLDATTLKQLTDLLTLQDFAAKRTSLFAGHPINASEGRPALHMALRADAQAGYTADDVPVMPAVLAAREQALAYAEQLRAGQIKGATGQKILHLIAIGIGGSDLGPRMVAEALADGTGPQVHFIRNIDDRPLRQLLPTLPPEQTFVSIASKTFTTAETLTNAQTVVDWLATKLGDKAKQHVLALTAHPEKAKKWGVPPTQIFPFWEWVGGRFSLWSSIGLPAMVALGRKNWEQLLAGGAAMDAHFRDAPLPQNLPVLLACLSIWNINFLGHTARAVLPYMEALAEWPGFLQQLEMESLGKAVDGEGMPATYATAPAVFGATGTPAQHAFMQALHQGPTIWPAEILLAARDAGAAPQHHATLNANALAQAEALAFGRSRDAALREANGDAALAAQKSFTGNRPSTLLLLDALTPFALGQLVALYEHKVFTEAVFWNLNPFDQWGVELGKQLAGPLAAALANKGTAGPGILAEMQKIRTK